MGVLFSKIGKILGPKFIYISYTKLCKAQVLTICSISTLRRQILNQSLLHAKRFGFYCGSYAGYKFMLPKVTVRQVHKKTKLAAGGLALALAEPQHPGKPVKLAFILPNYDGAKRIGPHNWDIICVLVGSLLGDGRAEREKSGGVRFLFKQFEVNKAYIFWLYEFFNKRGYCSNNLPVLYKDRNNLFALQGRYYGLVTYRYTSILWLYKLFYNNRKKKRVPNNISDLLTPLSLAVWISDKGVKYKSGIIIRTSSFTKEDILLLIFVLKTKFNIKSIIHQYPSASSYFLFYIKPESIPLLKVLLEPYIIPIIRYKLGL
jgi:hypothetical protein